jgi:very-short-patch-repair endonuclease
MNGNVAPVDGLIGEIATRQRGVISIAQLRRLGVSDDAVRARTLAGRLHRVHRGVYAVGHRGLPPEGYCLAAVLAVGGGPATVEEEEGVLACWKAAVSHRSAAFLWDLLPAASGLVDVAVKRNGRKPQRRGIRVHRPRHLSSTEVTLRHGIPVTTPARTIADLRGVVPERELRRAIRQAEVGGLPLGPQQGDRTRSDLERDFLRLCRRHRLPPPEVNVRLGRHLVDFLWRESKLVVETDGYRYHRGLVAFQEDRDRDLRLKRLGYEVLRVSERQVSDEPSLVAATLRAAMRAPPRPGPRA